MHYTAQDFTPLVSRYVISRRFTRSYSEKKDENLEEDLDHGLDIGPAVAGVLAFARLWQGKMRGIGLRLLAFFTILKLGRSKRNDDGLKDITGVRAAAYR